MGPPYVIHGRRKALLASTEPSRVPRISAIHSLSVGFPLPEDFGLVEFLFPLS